MKSILITGGTGFLGSTLVKYLAETGRWNLISPRRGVKRPRASEGVATPMITDIDAFMDWRLFLEGVDVVVHAAARVHVLKESGQDTLGLFRKENVEATLNLARQSVASGVKRFVFISSIKVNGEGTLPGQNYSADDTPEHRDAYSISKLEAVRGLLELASSTPLEVVIIRPVLIYGPGVKANFLNMMRWLHKGLPLPLGGCP